MKTENSKEGKHTPGPWSVPHLNAIQSQKDRIFWHCDVIKEGVGVASAHGIGEQEAVANARLIASAPELLEAATTAVESSSPVDASDLSRGVYISEKAYDLLRLAISKAK